MLKGAMPEMAGDEDDMGDEPMDMPEPPPAGDDDAEEPAMMEAEDANEEMNEEEMIQVARRVAARILKAKERKKGREHLEINNYLTTVIICVILRQ